MIFDINSFSNQTNGCKHWSKWIVLDQIQLPGFVKYSYLLIFTIFAFLLPKQVVCQNNKIDSLRLVLKKDLNDNIRINTFHKLIYYYQLKGSDSAHYFIDKSLKMSEKINYQEGIAFTIKAKGLIAELEGKYDTAEYHYLHFLEFSKLRKDDINMLDGYIALAFLNILKKEHDKALNYCRKAKEISKRLNNRHIWSIYNTIGLSYKEQLITDSAIYYFNKSKEFAQSQNNKQEIIYSSSNLTEILMSEKKYNQALKNFKEIIKLSIEINDNISTSASYLNISQIYAILAKNAEDVSIKDEYRKLSIETAEKSLFYADKLNSLENIMNAYKQLFLIYKFQQNFDKSVYYAEKTMKFLDSLFNYQKISAIKKEEMKYRNNIIEYEKHLQAEKIKKQKIIIKIVTFSSIVIVLLLMSLFIVYNKQRKLNTALLKLNKEIEVKNSEIIQKEKHLRQINTELTYNNNMKNQFFSILAHDLKNPFNTMIGFSDIINLKVKSGEYNDVSNYANILTETGKSTYNLLENLLNWAQFERNMIKYNPSSLNVYKLVEDTVKHLKDQIIAKGIDFTNQASKDAFIYADNFMISTIIRNLIYNAVKFTNRGGKISVSTKDIDNNKLNISVTDTGIGISKTVMEKIFKIDVISTLGTENEKGTGVGLLLCKEFAQKNGGNIDVISVIGKGTTFTLSLLKHPLK